ncbi:hypothetical protein MMC13_004691 [Lambiella insularis]|nr:hypothetical protein [Lambiella insularis]
MAPATAYQAVPASLESNSLSTICKEFTDGYCPYAEGCSQSHTHSITLIDETPLPKPHVQTVDPNKLSLEPRIAPPTNDAYFDEDGPGTLSSTMTARHDNDHILIQDIRILPTTDEILSLRRPYMPSKAADQPHHLPSGIPRYLDVAFRHLRYENIEPIIDLCYHGMQQLVASKQEETRIDYRFGLETFQRRRYSLFRNVAFEELIFHERKGAIVRLSYDCPRVLQGFKIHRMSGLFEEGMLCSLIGLHEDSDELTTTFFRVHLLESTDAMKSRTGNHTRSSIQLSFADSEDIAAIRRCAYYMHGLIKATFVLVDLPNVLLPSFALHLDRLQKLAISRDFSFAAHIAPSSPTENMAMAPPSYATANGFKFKLNNLKSSKDDIAPFEMQPIQSDGQPNDPGAILEALRTRTTLDQGQALALYESLNRGLAMTQGPPGTGKTFLGVALAQVILASQDKSDPKPILIASQTNRACDDFLQDLVKKGITKIVRLGGGSKEEWIKPYLLREVSDKLRLTTIERVDLKLARQQVENLARDGMGWAEALSKDTLGWHSLRDHIRKHHSDIFDHFTSLETLDSTITDLRRAKRYSGFAYEFWVSGGDIQDVSALLEKLDTLLGECELPNKSASSGAEFKEKIFASVKHNTEIVSATPSSEQIWSLSVEDRHHLVAQWIRELNPWTICEAFAELHRRHHAAFVRKNEVSRSIDARSLAQTQIIGLTTTGVVTHWELLNSLKLRVIITEEASECLEAHTVCSLFSSIQHALFIGDPLQLRPQINSMVLSTEHCSKYRLDESLFERMMISDSTIQVSRLNVQRRMHPEIADLSRAGDYEYLVDHESTKKNPPVVGMASRTYWLDHHQPEDRPDPRSPMSNSHSNRFEVEFCAALVKYLLERNGYSLGEIVILTPYNGQLAALYSRLQDTCLISLTDKDRDALDDLGLLPIPDKKTGSAKTSVGLSSMLRIVTVDNFQGEEAKVIIFSAVRSNKIGSIGFLRTRNRINVACSRARDGFYVIGNADLMGSVEHWAKRIEIFRDRGVLGTSFPVCCSRHPSRVQNVFEPEQFQSNPACSVICDENLSCGHRCTEL